MSWEVTSNEQSHAWDLRAAWAGGRAVVVRLEARKGRLERVEGFVTYVAASGAYVLVLDPEVPAEPIHVPCALIESVRRPHFHEPDDARILRLARDPRPRAIPVAAGQLSFGDSLFWGEGSGEA